MMSCLNGHKDIVNLLLLQPGVKINHQNVSAAVGLRTLRVRMLFYWLVYVAL